jgi:hypothetical protein
MENDKALHINEQVEQHANSGKVQEAADKAKRALDDESQAKDLKQAEEQGKSRAADRS